MARGGVRPVGIFAYKWVCNYATGRKECSFRPVMYAGMLREDLFFEPYDDGYGTKIEGQVLQSNITRRRNALAHVSQRAAFHRSPLI